ncbi:MAG: hypothetical protein PSV46_08685 [Reyranella sp.]|nr:hypothetical protein [Reyranella sp.]
MTTTADRGCRNAIVAGVWAALAAGATACAPAVPDQNLFTLSWGRLGSGYETFVGVRNDCVMAASVATENAAGRERAMPAVSASRFKDCMRARGWEAAAGGYSAPLGYDVRIVQ